MKVLYIEKNVSALVDLEDSIKIEYGSLNNNELSVNRRVLFGGLYQYMSKEIIFGEIEGIEEGHWFPNRKAIVKSSLHRNEVQGIDGNGQEGTSAIVLSGGYEDDEDLGDEIVYTGAGGQDSKKKQVKDQVWDKSGNSGLLTSMDRGLPVRVVRGHKHKSDYSPKSGYEYAGLYSVVDAWEEIGKNGFKICRYRLVYCGRNHRRKSLNDVELDYRKKDIQRKEGTVLRIVRDSKISQDIKTLYKFQCQVCEISIKTKRGFYAEGAHIKPLGRPHNGDDCIDNILCLCPNHHVMFDKGSFSITDDFELIGEESGSLIIHPHHQVNLMNLKYHRKCHGYS